LVQEIKNYLAVIGIIICLSIAINKVHDFYFTNKPVAAVGECLKVQDPNLGHLEIKIVSNDNDAGISEVTVRAEIMTGVKISVPAEAKYSELRDLGAKKVECSK
jgi:hypothetical protein